MNISEVMPNGNVRVVIPIQLCKTGRGRVIVRRENTQTVQNQIPLLKAIAKFSPEIMGKNRRSSYA